MISCYSAKKSFKTLKNRKAYLDERAAVMIKL